MTVNLPPRAGYTLPVFACAAAIAALRHLQTAPTNREPIQAVNVDLVQPATTVSIPIEQVASLPDGATLAIARSDPGDNLDLTRHTPVWAVVQWASNAQTEAIALHGGEGIGYLIDQPTQPAIYQYAQTLLQTNLAQLLAAGERIQVTIILPEGRSLAQRTSNAAFGIVEGLSLLGTSGIAQPLSTPGQLELFRHELQQRAQQYPSLVFCIGENGLDLARNYGIPPDRCLKTANWLGSLLVEAGLQGIQAIVLFGYHGKLIKLAGGIFHTHHHVADARREILTAQAAIAGLPPAKLQVLWAAPTAEAALQHLRDWENQTSEPWVQRIYAPIAATIEQRATAYIQTHTSQTVQVGCYLFDRDRQAIVTSAIAMTVLNQIRGSTAPLSDNS